MLSKTSIMPIALPRFLHILDHPTEQEKEFMNEIMEYALINTMPQPQYQLTAGHSLRQAV